MIPIRFKYWNKDEKKFEIKDGYQLDSESKYGYHKVIMKEDVHSKKQPYIYVAENLILKG